MCVPPEAARSVEEDNLPRIEEDRSLVKGIRVADVWGKPERGLGADNIKVFQAKEADSAEALGKDRAAFVVPRETFAALTSRGVRSLPCPRALQYFQRSMAHAGVSCTIEDMLQLTLLYQEEKVCEIYSVPC